MICNNSEPMPVPHTVLLGFRGFWILLGAMICCLVSTDILAQTLEDNTVFGPLSTIESTMRSFQSSLNTLMLNTFWLLATIEFAFALLMGSATIRRPKRASLPVRCSVWQGKTGWTPAP